MIVEPDQRVPDFIKAGADIVSVHCENASTIHLHRTINQVCVLEAFISQVHLEIPWFVILSFGKKVESSACFYLYPFWVSMLRGAVKGTSDMLFWK